jgi:lipopolysaccharide export system protein LptA
MAPAMTIAAPPDATASVTAPAPTETRKRARGQVKTASVDDSGKAVGEGSPFAGFEGSNHGPINIHSDTLNLDYKGNAVLFTGHVHAVQSGSELTSNSLQVKYGKDFHEVQEMIAEGNVRMSQGERWATGDRAVLEQAVHTVVLTGSPVVHDGQDQIAGTKITVHLDTGKSEVSEPKAVIFPRDTKNRDNSGVAADHAQ